MISGLNILNVSLFLLAVCLTIWNINQRFNTNKTTTFTNNERLEQIPFPLKFSILINPGFDLSKLDEVGYSHAGSYLFGVNKWKKNRIGWAGLNEDGSTVGNVSGKFLTFFFISFIISMCNHNYDSSNKDLLYIVYCRFKPV